MPLFRYYAQSGSPGAPGDGGPSSSPDDFATVMAAKSPLAWWRLGEPSGTTATDEEAVQNGTYVGSPTLGASGYTSDGDTGVTLSGSGQYVTVPDNAAWDLLTSDLSLMAAASISTWPTVEPAMLIGRSAGGGAGDYSMWLSHFLTNRVTIRLAGTTYNLDTGVTLAGTGFHLYGASFDRDALLTLTIDGVSVATADISAQAATSLSGNNVIGLGADANLVRYYLAGTLDECAIFASALSTTDWADIHAARTV